jgi:hypothetical protein
VVRELEVATTSDARGSTAVASSTALGLAVVSSCSCGSSAAWRASSSRWCGRRAIVFGLRALDRLRAPHLVAGTAAVVTAVSGGVFALNVLAPDRARSGSTSCVLTGNCPSGTGR